jgi:hypothetical protein
MQKSTVLSLLGLSITCTVLYSCTGNSGKQFSNKQDSLSFAQAVMQKYPGQKPLPSVERDTTGPDKPQPYEMQPISWETVKKYQYNYDNDPQLRTPGGLYYKGFSIDTAGYAMLLKTTEIRSLYLRLGKRDDGSYTIMVLGMDAKGNIIHTITPQTGLGGDEPTNFDNLPPCPANCPPLDHDSIK